MLTHEVWPDTQVDDLTGVEHLFEAWVDAVGRRDAAGIARLHIADGVLQLPRSAGARGRAEIRRRCADWLCRDSCEASFALGETRLFGAADIATCNGRFTLTWPQGSNGNEDRGRLLLVAEKEPGRWGLRFSGLFSDAFLSSLANLAH